VPETVVVGGGAAGIAAARRLYDAGREVLLLEAGERLGGRAHSVAYGSYTLDHGCGWLHSATRNPWTRIAEAGGFRVDRSSPGWGEQWRDLGFPPEQQQAFGEAWHRWEERARAAANGPDRPLSAFIDPDDSWRPMIDAISNYANGAAIDRVSLHDWIAYENASTDDNWALPEGYGTLIVQHAAGVPLRLFTLVSKVDHGGRVIRIHTNAGVVEADHVIVAVPTSALANDAITFDPPLPDKQAAAAALPLGLADKVFLLVDRPEWPAHAHLIGDPHRVCTASHRLSPFGWPIVESFFGADCAEAMDGEAGSIAFAVDELVHLLGSEWRRRLRPLGATRWRTVPFIHGSYSHAEIGQAGQRQVLREPVDGRLFFAGEACHPTDFSTAHGAYETGIAAADAVIAAG
jgi:monoamine oxidase